MQMGQSPCAQPHATSHLGQVVPKVIEAELAIGDVGDVSAVCRPPLLLLRGRRSKGVQQHVDVGLWE
jgi:hypothetical protein